MDWSRPRRSIGRVRLGVGLSELRSSMDILVHSLDWATTRWKRQRDNINHQMPKRIRVVIQGCHKT